jgi:copper homeostasis protein
MVEASEGKPFTFHRAFDKCRNPQEALEQIIDAGCKRILTSGQQPSAEQGIPLLHKLNKQADGRIIIMPGGGVNEKNARLILDQTGCIEIHGSCSSGSGVTSAERVSQVKAIIGG